MQKLLYGVAALIALLIIIGIALPRSHRIEVSTEIDAYPATVFALLDDFRRHALWSTLLENDPNADVRYFGSDRGLGAGMSWDGAVAGSGVQTIVESMPFESLTLSINPGEPGESISRFDIVAGNGTTTVTRSSATDYGMNIVGRYFAPMLGSVIARDYQNGLAKLRQLAESLPRANFADLQVEHVRVEASTIAYVATTSRPDADAVSAAMSDAYFQILNFIEQQGLEVAGAPLSILRSWSGAARAFDAAIPVKATTGTAPRDALVVKIGRSYGGLAVRTRHLGSYRTLANTHRKIAAYLAAYGIERSGAAWESYESDPAEVAEDDMLTYIYYPVKTLPKSAQTDLTRNGGTRTGSSSPRRSATVCSSGSLDSSLNSARTCAAHSLASSGDILRTDAQTGLSPLSGVTRYMD